MTQCKQCLKRKKYHWHVMVEDGRVVRYCDDCWRGAPSDDSIIILKDKTEKRADHWNEIRTRVTTHEGELLHGKQGLDYQKKWSRAYLGRDIGNVRPITADRVREFEKTKK